MIAKVLFTLIAPGCAALGPYIFAVLKWNDTARRWIATSDTSFWQIAAMALALGLLADAVTALTRVGRAQPVANRHYLVAAAHNGTTALYLCLPGLVWRFYDAPIHLFGALALWSMAIHAMRRFGTAAHEAVESP